MALIADSEFLWGVMKFSMVLVLKREDGDRHHQSTQLELSTQCNSQSGLINLGAPTPREYAFISYELHFWRKVNSSVRSVLSKGL